MTKTEMAEVERLRATEDAFDSMLAEMIEAGELVDTGKRDDDGQVIWVRVGQRH